MKKFPLKSHPINLYEQDYLQWIQTTLNQLQYQDYANVDWENLIEEIADMGRRERRSFVSNLIILLLHLLKWQYQIEMRSGSCKGSIIEHRRRLHQILKDSPSLKPYLEEILPQCYQDARQQASAETELSLETFPPNCHYQISEIIDSEFFPHTPN